MINLATLGNFLSDIDWFLGNYSIICHLSPFSNRLITVSIYMLKISSHKFLRTYHSSSDCLNGIVHDMYIICLLVHIAICTVSASLEYTTWLQYGSWIKMRCCVIILGGLIYFSQLNFTSLRSSLTALL